MMLWGNDAVDCLVHKSLCKCPQAKNMERIKGALLRPRLKFLFCVSYVVKTAADSIKGKDSLCPQHGLRWELKLVMVFVEGKKT